MEAGRVAPLRRARPPTPTPKPRGSTDLFPRQGRASNVRGRNGASRRGRGGASRAAWDGDLMRSALSPARAGGRRGGLSQSPVLGPPWGPSRGGRGWLSSSAVAPPECSSRPHPGACRNVLAAPGERPPPTPLAPGGPSGPSPRASSPRNAPGARRSPPARPSDPRAGGLPSGAPLNQNPRCLACYFPCLLLLT